MRVFKVAYFTLLLVGGTDQNHKNLIKIGKRQELDVVGESNREHM